MRSARSMQRGRNENVKTLTFVASSYICFILTASCGIPGDDGLSAAGGDADDPKGAKEIFAEYMYKKIDFQLHPQKLDSEGTPKVKAHLLKSPMVTTSAFSLVTF